MPPGIIGQGRESLTRKEIVQRMQVQLDDLGLSNKMLNRILNAFLEVYKESMLDSDRIEIRGFGIMKSQLIKGREIRHPETQETIPAEPYYRISFIPSQSFRDKLKERAKEEVVRT